MSFVFKWFVIINEELTQSIIFKTIQAVIMTFNFEFLNRRQKSSQELKGEKLSFFSLTLVLS